MLDKKEGFLPPPHFDGHFGNKLQALRGFYRMKQKEVAHLLGISQKAYSRLEQKEIAPNQILIEKIRNIFNENNLMSSELTLSNEKKIKILEAPCNIIASTILKEIEPELNTIYENHIENNDLYVEIAIKISCMKNEK